MLKEVWAKLTANKKARHKHKKKYKEPNRWRYVLVWVIPFATVPITFSIFANRIRGVWLSVLLWIAFAWYCVILLEWHIWKADQARERKALRIATACVSVLLACGGFVWQRRFQKAATIAKPSSPRDMDTVRDRAFLFYKLDGIVKPLEPDQPIVIDFIVSNSGSKEARLHVMPPTAHYEDMKNPFPTSLTPLKAEYSSYTIAPSASLRGTVVVSSTSTLTARIVRAIKEGKARLIIAGKGEYSDSSGNTYPFPFCRVYDPQLANLVMCPLDLVINEPN